MQFKLSKVSVHKYAKIVASVMPKCFYRASSGLKKNGFPPKTCGNDRFTPFCERLLSKCFYLLILFMLTNSIQIFSQTAQQENEPTDFAKKVNLITEKHLEKLDAAFILYDAKNDQYARYNPERCQKPYQPCSTFKIANALIALETGVADGPDFMIPFDSTKTPPQDWWAQFGWLGDQTLRSAMKKSVVWYYQEIARRIGPDRMRHFLDVLNYGNRDISGGIDQFWLMNSLLISPNEQVEFLKRFYQEEFKLSKLTYKTVKSILLFDEK
ncbi:class D beta-lactamase, partial [candidate division KSB1 bacterium]|nr:class D beta-lactamase [candidate division KSB1 bacterium]